MPGAIKIKKYGKKENPLFSVWWSMIQRCRNPNVKRYCRYGGRGITVCDRWMLFENFVSDMGDRPSPKHSLDRIDNDGNYEPSNCRWATATEQARNSTAARLVTFNGKTASLAEWSEITGLYYLVILKRLNRGWSVKRALFTPVDRTSKYIDRTGSRKISFNGETLILSDWARRLGMTKVALSSRIEKWGLEQALSRPKRGSCE